MSVSINTYYKNSLQQPSLLDQSSTAAKQSELQSDDKKKSADSLQLSQEMLGYMSGYQQQYARTTEIYSPDSSVSELTTEQKKSILVHLQWQLHASLAFQQGDDGSTLGTDTDGGPLGLMNDALSGIDLSTAADEEITNLFDEMKQTMNANRPAPPQGPPPAPSEEAFSAKELTTEQIRSLLTDLQIQLGNIDLTDKNEEDEISNDHTDSTLLTAIKNAVSEVDLSSATDEEILNLLDTITELLESNRPEPPPLPDRSELIEQAASESTEASVGLPPMLRALSGVLPPFAWQIAADADVDLDADEWSGDSTTEIDLRADYRKQLIQDLQTQLSKFSS
ncbi:hypothetical protein [Paenibacillus sp. Leaf72]|uniref:hypothetical protein n=1 Tax=Paenibacillus sp. Leaf72 TaxID=1736234 RepID=UPI0006FBDF8E|nr:hypothetical protein [Paenibacillus sp. Leaf72]KQN96071.1 hypothetical protein ASF12_24900 [Paenibacillus sp. Leaf72]